MLAAERLAGVGASRGIALGPVFVIESAERASERHIQPADVDAEQARLREAAAVSARELELLADGLVRAGAESEAGIFKAQALMAEDAALLGSALGRIATHAVDAATAILAVGNQHAVSLRALDDEVLSGRAADVLDVADRIAARARGETRAAPVFDRAAIVVAHDLAPSATASLSREMLLGIVLEAGSATAHAAILARAYGIPAVVGAAGAVAALRRATEVAIDGSSGEVVADPDDATVRAFRARDDVARSRVASARAVAGEPAITPDGVRVTLLANLGSPDEVDEALGWGAEGVGLFRTEFLFLERTAPPDEDEQEHAYRRVLRAFAPRPVTIRLLDIGGDKNIPYLGLPPEANPFLGVRALRLAAARRDLFRTQLRALLRASDAGTLKVMAPMVADMEDVALLRGLFDDAVAETGPTGAQLGIMIEIPSAAILAEQLLAAVDFASLGTNDLLQYVLAADRGNAALARYHDPLHPALLQLIAAAARGASQRGKPLSVCGEMAGDVFGAAVLVGLGLRELSMAPTALGETRALLRATPFADLAAMATSALELSTATAVRALVRATLEGGPRGPVGGPVSS
jgi:phosphoenolpyruvate-protein phosphotransferase